MSAPFLPMLCKDAPGKPPRLPGGSGWVMEKKEDGWRWLIHVTESGTVRSYGGRNGSDYTGCAAELEESLRFLPPDTVLDGELLPNGHSCTSTVAMREDKVWFYAFDLLRVNGVDLIDRPWKERRQLLERASEGFDPALVRVSDVYTLDPALHERWLDEGSEGSVCKRIDSLYRPGARSADWPKVKPQKTAEAVIVGFKTGTGSNLHRLSSFEVRMVDTGATTWVGTSTEEQTQEVTDHPDRFLHRHLELRHHGIGESGVPRHPVFLRMRPDRDPA